MHSAPAVSYAVGRSRFQGQLTGVLAAFGCMAGAWWWSVVDTPGWRQGLFFVGLLMTGFVSVRAWLRSFTGVLSWNGETWHFSGDQVVVSGEVRLHLDLQFCLLICFRSEDGRRLWLWPERRTTPAEWLALRRAVMFSAANRASRSAAEASALLKP